LAGMAWRLKLKGNGCAGRLQRIEWLSGTLIAEITE